MSTRKLALALSVGLVTACLESTGPPIQIEPDLVVADGMLHRLRWKQSERPRTFTARGYPDEERILTSASQTTGDPATLSTYQVSFWAVPGETREIRIDYQDDTGDDQPFLRFTVPRNALKSWPDGREFAGTDSILITVELDTTQFLVRLEPTGLQFEPNKPAVLQIWYAGADEDLDGDGDVDGDDTYIELELLRVWYEESEGQPWYGLNSTQDLSEKSYTVDLLHFSGYAVSW